MNPNTPLDANREQSGKHQIIVDAMKASMLSAVQGIPTGTDDAIREEQPMPSTSDDQTVANLRVQLAEARTETKLAEIVSRSDARQAELVGRMDAGFAKIEGQFAAVNARLEGIERTTGGIKTTVIVTGLAIAALVVAILTYGQTWFGIGISARDVVRATVLEMQPPAKPGGPSAQ